MRVRGAAIRGTVDVGEMSFEVFVSRHVRNASYVSLSLVSEWVKGMTFAEYFPHDITGPFGAVPLLQNSGNRVAAVDGNIRSVPREMTGGSIRQ